MYLIPKERIFFYEWTRIHYYVKSGKKSWYPQFRGTKIPLW